MSRIETCFKCDQPTGKAGPYEDSQMIEGHPYCEDCYMEGLLKSVDDLGSRIRELEADNEKLHILLVCARDKLIEIRALVRPIIQNAPCILKEAQPLSAIKG